MLKLIVSTLLLTFALADNTIVVQCNPCKSFTNRECFTYKGPGFDDFEYPLVKDQTCQKISPIFPITFNFRCNKDCPTGCDVGISYFVFNQPPQCLTKGLTNSAFNYVDTTAVPPDPDQVKYIADLSKRDWCRCGTVANPFATIANNDQSTGGSSSSASTNPTNGAIAIAVMDSGNNGTNGTETNMTLDIN